MVTINRKLVLAILLIVTSMEVAGMYARYTEAQLVESSERIVVGTIIGRTTLRVTPDANELNVAIIAIEERLKGDSAESVALLVLPGPGMPIASDTISYKVGQQGLWFLRLRQAGTSGIYLADHPQRFEPMAGITERVASLKKLVDQTN